MSRDLLPFARRPLGSLCPKCATSPTWQPRYDEFLHPTGYVETVDIRKGGEHICWGCSYCGYVVMTQCADASVRERATA